MTENATERLTPFNNVALLMGGWSAEREVSLKSGQAVYQALLDLKLNVCAIDVDRNIYEVLRQGQFDCAINLLHGRGGEDGVIQSILELLNIPYTGTGVLGSALSMDKVRSKHIWMGLHLPTPEFACLYTAKDCVRAMELLGLPLIVKPSHEGSSIGVSKVENTEEMLLAWEEAARYGLVIAERWIEGKEYTVALLHNTALPAIRIETPRKFYDYHAKYLDDSTRYYCPCGLPIEVEARCKELALQAFNAIGGQGWGRVDFMLDTQQTPWLIDVNTVPGMTDHSLVPKAAQQAGIDFHALALKILATAESRNHAK